MLDFLLGLQVGFDMLLGLDTIGSDTIRVTRCSALRTRCNARGTLFVLQRTNAITRSRPPIWTDFETSARLYKTFFFDFFLQLYLGPPWGIALG